MSWTRASSACASRPQPARPRPAPGTRSRQSAEPVQNATWRAHFNSARKPLAKGVSDFNSPSREVRIQKAPRSRSISTDVSDTRMTFIDVRAQLRADPCARQDRDRGAKITAALIYRVLSCEGAKPSRSIRRGPSAVGGIAPGSSVGRLAPAMLVECLEHPL